MLSAPRWCWPRCTRSTTTSRASSTPGWRPRSSPRPTSSRAPSAERAGWRAEIYGLCSEIVFRENLWLFRCRLFVFKGLFTIYAHLSDVEGCICCSPFWWVLVINTALKKSFLEFVINCKLLNISGKSEMSTQIKVWASMQRQSQNWKLWRGKILRQWKSVYTG